MRISAPNQKDTVIISQSSFRCGYEFVHCPVNESAAAKAETDNDIDAV